MASAGGGAAHPIRVHNGMKNAGGDSGRNNIKSNMCV